MSVWIKDVLAGLCVAAFITFAMCALPLLAPSGAAELRQLLNASTAALP